MVRYRSRRRTDRTVIVSREYHVTEVKVARIDLLARAVLPEYPTRKGGQGERRGVDQRRSPAEQWTVMTVRGPRQTV